MFSSFTSKAPATLGTKIFLKNFSKKTEFLNLPLIIALALFYGDQ